MHASLFVAALAAAAGPVSAWPGMTPGGGSGAAAHAHHHARFHNSDMYKEIKRAAEADSQNKAVEARHVGEEHREHERSIDLLGDLLHLADKELTDVGKAIKLILSGQLSPHAPRPGHGAPPPGHPQPTTTAKTTSTQKTTSTSSTSTKKTTSTTSKKTTSTSTKKTTTSTSTKKTTTTTPKTTSTTTKKTTTTAPKTTSTSTKKTTTTTPKTTSTSTKKTPTTTSSSTKTTATVAPTQASCSVWKQVANTIVPTFKDGNNGCSALARGAIRLGFHDAGAWNTTAAWGGADGSILLNPSELARSENNGLGPIANQTIAWYNQWKSQGVGMADLIQFSAIVATVTCPLGPRIKFYAGRPDDSRAAIDGLLPSAFDTAPNLIALFQAKSFSAADLVALVGAHSTSEQFFADPALAGESQDSTPGVWDTKFYAETTQNNAPNGVYRFPSDIALSKFSSTSGTWQRMNNQGAWNGAYANAYFRMSLLGVNNINSLTDCSSAIP